MDAGKPRTYRLAELVERFGGEALGDADIRQVAPIERAGPNELAFVASGRYRRELERSGAGAVIVGEALRDATTKPRVVCGNPLVYFAHVAALLNPPRLPSPGIHPSAVVQASARIPASAHVGANVVVGDRVVVGENSIVEAGSVLGDGVAIGDNTRLFANVTIYHDCAIGRRVVLHAGVVIGADGFGLAEDEGRWLKIPQIGRVVIGDDVEIGANTTVDRGAMDDTVIEEGVKLDNQIQIGHNVRIGAHTAIAACTGIAGSVKIGRHCRIGGAAGISGHIEIADHVDIAGAAVITKSITAAGHYGGLYPFERHRDWLKNVAHLRHLDELAKRIRELEKKLTERGER